MNQSETLTKLLPALIKAQAKIESVAKSTSNPYFNSKYADLTSCIAAVKPALLDNDLVVFQIILSNEDKYGIRTRLSHSSGEFIESEVFCGVKNANNPQEAGSVYTYLRRYSLSALLMLEQEDDDANKASGVASSKSSSPPVPNKAPTKASEAKQEFDPKEYITKLKKSNSEIEMFKTICKKNEKAWADFKTPADVDAVFIEVAKDLEELKMQGM
jgi:hypothetical protein